MTIRLSTLVWVALGLLGAVALWSTSGRVAGSWPGAANLTAADLAGFYEEEQTKFLEGPFGLKFFDDGRVDVFMGGNKIGETARYAIGDGRIRVHHACGV